MHFKPCLHVLLRTDCIRITTHENYIINVLKASYDTHITSFFGRICPRRAERRAERERRGVAGEMARARWRDGSWKRNIEDGRHRGKEGGPEATGGLF